VNPEPDPDKPEPKEIFTTKNTKIKKCFVFFVPFVVINNKIA
jgi:hypothetical protein